MNWDELAAGIKGIFPDCVRGEDWVAVRWPSGQSQRFQLVDSRSSGLLLLVLCELGPTVIASTQLLELNMTLRFGAAATHRGRCVLRHAIPLADAKLEILLHVAGYLATTAERFRSVLAREANVHAPYAD